MANSYVVVNQENNTVVVTNTDPDGESIVTQNLVVSSVPTVNIISPNTNPGTTTINYNQPPAASNSTGAIGEIRFDNNFIYLCVMNNVWKKIALQDL